MPVTQNGSPDGFRVRRLLAAPVSFLLLLSIGGLGRSEASRGPGISRVAVSRPFFNPSLRQDIEISIALGKPGFLSLSVVDQTGLVVCQLASGRKVRPGKLAYVWDGRDTTGEVVPDEAYSIRIVLLARGGKESYDPALKRAREVSATTTFYDPQTGVLAYKLAGAARVQIQARSSRAIRTVLGGEPRTAGSVIDHWNGFDESGRVYLPGQPNFSISISAAALPENAIITVGKRAAAGGK
jgi:flagellar hook assembly protein FlgD